MPRKIRERVKIKKGDKVLLDSRIIRKIDHIRWILFVHPDIEEIFKGEKVDVSSTWTDPNGEPYEFYTEPHYDTNTELGGYIHNQGCYSNYGNYFFKEDGTPNLAVLRTVGISSHPLVFKLRRPYAEETLIEGQRVLKQFIVKLYHDFIRPVTIKTELTIIDTI